MSGRPLGIVEIGSSAFRFDVINLDDELSPGWAHHGVTVLSDGTIVACEPDRACLIRVAPGRDVERIETDLTEMHGIRSIAGHHGDAERLFVADNGHKFVPGFPHYGEVHRPGRVVGARLDGTVDIELFAPDIEAYEHDGWEPCAVAIDEVALGGTGEMFVADGYGKSLLHRFTADGVYHSTIDGSASGRVFHTPHDVFIDRRREVAEVYVADRSNRRIVVLDLQGAFLRTVGEGMLTSPSGFARSGDLLFVSELHGRVVVLDNDDRFIAELGAHDDHERPGWPNAQDESGATVPYRDAPGPLFNSPHGIATGLNGELFVTEWRIGGRLIRLEPIT